jgi:ankyrin repeat protein
MEDQLGETELPVSIVHMLIQKRIENDEHSADILSSVTSNTELLLVAATNGYIEMIEPLAKLGTDLDFVDQHNMAAIYLAAQSGHTDVVVLLIKLGCNVKTSNRVSVMHYAAVGGHEDVIRALNQLDPELIDICDSDGKTPMHAAAETGSNPGVIKLLGQHNIDKVTKGGLAPIHLAARCGNAVMVEAFIGLNVDLCRQCTIGITPLYLAVYRGMMEKDHINYVKIIEMLLIGNSDAIRMVDKFGDTIFASLIGNSRAIKIMNKIGGAPVFITDPESSMHLVIELLVRFDSSVLDSVSTFYHNPLRSYVRAQNGTHTKKTPYLVTLVSLFGGIIEYHRLCEAKRIVPVEITENELVEVRYRTYFSCSLVYYLLCVGQSRKL